jgi:hypothetical protein
MCGPAPLFWCESYAPAGCDGSSDYQTPRISDSTPLAVIQKSPLAFVIPTQVWALIAGYELDGYRRVGPETDGSPRVPYGLRPAFGSMFTLGGASAIVDRHVGTDRRAGHRADGQPGDRAAHPRAARPRGDQFDDVGEHAPPFVTGVPPMVGGRRLSDETANQADGERSTARRLPGGCPGPTQGNLCTANPDWLPDRSRFVMAVPRRARAAPARGITCPVAAGWRNQAAARSGSSARSPPNPESFDSSAMWRLATPVMMPR